jgi:trehalose 6-phosphate phosphatase
LAAAFLFGRRTGGPLILNNAGGGEAFRAGYGGGVHATSRQDVRCGLDARTWGPPVNAQLLLPAPPLLALASTALFADLDGCLVPIRPRPDDVGPDSARAALLDQAVAALGGAFAIVSGRGLGDIDRVLEERITAIAAVHGLVRRTAGGAVTIGTSVAIPDAVRAAAAALAAEHPALTIEDKTWALALHYRAEPALEPIVRRRARVIASGHRLGVQEGGMVVELRPCGPTKGDAVAAFMREAPFAGRTPVFIGDDLTDEDGFSAARGLGGFGVIVGERRPTRAHFALADVEAALAWLGASLTPHPPARGA